MKIACSVPLLLCCMAMKCAMRKYVSYWSSLSCRTKITSDRTLMVTLKRYLSHMRCTRVWGTGVEILATASLLQIPVFTLIPKWITINDSVIILSVGIGLLSHLKDPPLKQLSCLNHIELLKVRGCHYDCILSQDGDYPLDEPPLEQCSSLLCLKLGIVCMHIFFIVL